MPFSRRYIKLESGRGSLENQMTTVIDIRPGGRRHIAVLALLLLASVQVKADDWHWQAAGRVVAISDVHGALRAFERTLGASGLIGDDGQWSGGGSHLVITGDLLDRGASSRAVMDLLMRLEQEALAAGGRVHVLLGNHEVMNLVGDLRYVAAGEYAAFAADESADERQHWFRQFAQRAAANGEAMPSQQQFDRQFPAGFFAHRRAFRHDGEYGRWLLRKPLVVVVNDTAFVHGGLSPGLAGIGLEGINAGMAGDLADYVRALAVLTDAGILQPGDSFYTYVRLLDDLPVDVERPDAVAAAIETVRRLDNAAIHDSESPVWYRGTAGCSPRVEAARLQPVLDALGASRVVIGHTPTVTRGVVSRSGGRVIGIDTGMLNEYYKGSGHALVIEGDKLAVVSEHGEMLEIGQDPRLNGAGPLSTDALQTILADGDLVTGTKRADGTHAMRVTHDGVSVDALFYQDAGPELAAYRLDRLLDLQMVPVTVARTVDGRDGALQLLPAGHVDETGRREAGAGASAWCPLQAQWQAMYLFDTLAHKARRGPEQMLYDRRTWQLMLNGHGDAFGTGRGRPRYLRNVDIEVDAAWQDALSGLGDEQLDEELGTWLDRRRMRALVNRRDNLLER